ncbi:MAG: lipid IV(A) 3-deoxy-D-manno-octulosonic acid transferase [Tahibacter sp.]
MFPRFLYTFVMYLLTPVILFRLARRGLHYRSYLGRWRERFGFFPDPGFDASIWIHAVSVGEVNAALPLIEALMLRHADTPFVITTITPTGSERVQKVFGERVFHVYLPYDLPASVRRFLSRVRPRLGVVMETEIWPNLFVECEKRGVPVVVANARLSQKSLRGYGPVRPLARRAIRSARFVAAQSALDAERLLELGADSSRLAVLGNVKFDMAVPANLAEHGRNVRAAWGQHRPVWIAASTHEGEELTVLKAHAAVLRRFPDALLLIAPRHPERFRPVSLACRSFGYNTRTRSEDVSAQVETQCFVVDTLGELLRYFACCDIAFVGGSLVPIGGHNVLEPAALSVPVVVGPNTFNFAEITRSLVSAGGALQIGEADQLAPTVLRLLGDNRKRLAMGEAARDVFERERGAVARNMAAIEQVLLEREGRETGKGESPVENR